jgi:hypothetical protein
MPYILELPKFSDKSGDLTVLEKIIPFDIKRIYFLHNIQDKRGGHRHKKCFQALISLGGRCDIYVNDGENEKVFHLDRPEMCLILNPNDWHTMDNFSTGVFLLVIASEFYDIDDYIDEEY